MISIETEARVAKILLAIADGEKNTDAVRQLLAQQKDFDPYNTFRLLDKSFRNSLSEYELLSFLKTLAIFPSTNELRNVISLYDANSDGNLIYSEFINLIVTEADPTLRRLAQDRSSYFPNRNPFLSPEIEYTLGRLFEKEIELVRLLSNMISELNLRYDYDVVKMFGSLDEFTLNYLTLENLRAFMMKNGVELFESDYAAIFKRLDIDGDGRISFWEFKRVFTISSSVLEPQSNLNQSLYNTRKQILTASRDFGTSSPVRVQTQTNSFLSPVRQTNLNSLNLSRSYNRSDVNRSYNEFRQTLPLNKMSTYEEELFLEYLRDCMVNERELERQKCELTIKSDFNLGDLYKIFELNRLGYLTASDLKYGMNLFNVFPSLDELNLLIRRYDGSSTLSSFAFNNMLLPVDKEYNRILRNRVCLDYHVKHTPDVFSFESRYAIQNLFKTLIDVENKAEQWRQKLYKINTFFSKAIYDKFDTLGKNYISSDDISGNFRVNNVFYSIKDLDLLFFKFDKNKDDRISYSEFVDELIPKSRDFLLYK